MGTIIIPIWDTENLDFSSNSQVSEISHHAKQLFLSCNVPNILIE